MAFVTPTPLARFSTLPSHRTTLRRPTTYRPSRTSLVRMVAAEPAEPVTATPLSTKAKELIGYIRGHKSIFRPGVGFSSTAAALFRKNDTGRTFTPLDELATSANMLPGGSVAALMVVHEDDLVAMAAEAALEVSPELRDDEIKREVFEYDLRVLLRVISYAAAAQSTDFLHEDNMNILKRLHKEVGIGSEVDAAGLNKAKEEVCGQLESDLVPKTAACFDVVVDFLS